jgi:FRG domain
VSYPGHYQVDSVDEAVALARKLMGAGQYSIFRGQTVDWPMRSSFCRLRPPEQVDAEQRLLEFAAYIHRTSELADLHWDRFRVMAIAQHYGIPTVLVDFTMKPTVAGWFASHGNFSKEGRPSVIYMAHEEYVARRYRDRLPPLHVLWIAVDNLWRLQAQSGLFLHLPFVDKPDLDEWLLEAFGSIRFPYRGPTSDIPESAIYPARKSRLEVLLDGFITEERLRKVNASYEAAGLKLLKLPDLERPAEAFLGEHAPPVHESWTPSRIGPWLRPPAERFRRQDNPPEVLLEVGSEGLKQTDPRVLEKQLATQIEYFMAGQENARMGFVNFRLYLSESKTWLDDHIKLGSRLRRTVKQEHAAFSLF